MPPFNTVYTVDKIEEMVQRAGLKNANVQQYRDTVAAKDVIKITTRENQRKFGAEVAIDSTTPADIAIREIETAVRKIKEQVLEMLPSVNYRGVVYLIEVEDELSIECTYCGVRESADMVPDDRLKQDLTVLYLLSCTRCPCQRPKDL